MKGQGPIGFIIILAVIVVLVVAVIPTMTSLSASGSTANLESRGYVVLSSGEYSDIIARLEAIKVAALDASNKAQSAAVAANETQVTLLLHNENIAYLFPDSTTVNVTLTSGTPANTFSSWASVVATNGTALSSVFSAHDGYLVEVMTHDYSANATDKMYIIELATANDGSNIIGRVKVRSDWTYILNLESARIITGRPIYYRMVSEVSGGKLNADFRYYWR